MMPLDKADTAFVLISAALVLLMTPGLALFYAGMVRAKNVLGTIMQSFIMIALVSFEWVYLGYSLSFGPDMAGVIGNLSWFGLGGVSLTPNPAYGPTIPHLVFAIFQCMFAVITPALITGAFAERVRFGPLAALQLSLDGDRIQSRVSLGVGHRGMAEEHGSSGLCGRAGRSSFMRGCSACRHYGDQSEKGPWL